MFVRYIWAKSVGDDRKKCVFQLVDIISPLVLAVRIIEMFYVLFLYVIRRFRVSYPPKYSIVFGDRYVCTKSYVRDRIPVSHVCVVFTSNRPFFPTMSVHLGLC